MVKDKNYSPEQEAAIIAAVKSCVDNYSQKQAIEKLEHTPLFRGFKTERQITAKLLHLSKSNAINRPLYFPVVYQPKEAAVVIRKSALLVELSDLLGVDVESIDSLSGGTKLALMLVIDALKNAKTEAIDYGNIVE